MVRLIAMGNSLSAVVQALASEFGCSERTIYHDYEVMDTWAHAIEQDKQLTTILRARLDYFNREAMDLLTDWEKKPQTVKEKFVKIGALNTALKITIAQIKLGQNLGLIERKPEVVVIKQKPEEQEIDLSKLSENERKSILYAEEVLSRTEKEAGAR
jgi:transcriptional antiterminator